MTEQPHATTDPDLRQADPEIADLVRGRAERQRDTIRLIASRELRLARPCSRRPAPCSPTSTPRATPGKRYYEGQQVIDQVETLAIERAKALFGVDHANVQPYSGSPANLAVYLAFLQPGRHRHGHGAARRRPPHPRLERVGHRQVVPRGAVRRAQGRPAASTSTRSATLALAASARSSSSAAAPPSRAPSTSPAFAEIAREVGAVLVADIAHIAGLVAGGAHPSPVGHADVITTTTHKTLRGPRGGDAHVQRRARQGARQGRLPRPAGRPAQPHHRRHRGRAAARRRPPTFRDYAHADRRQRQGARRRRSPTRGFDLVSGGTDNHLILVDLTNKERRRASRPRKALDRAGIELNYNTVPFDPRKPFDPSGIRIGTAAVTTRGMSTAEMDRDRRLDRRRRSRPRRPATRRPSRRSAPRCATFARGFPMPGADR